MKTQQEGQPLICPWCSHVNNDLVEDWVLKSGELPSTPNICEACENVIWVKRDDSSFLITCDKRDFS